MWDKLFYNANIATIDGTIAAPYGTITNGVIAIKDDEISFIGSLDELPDKPEKCAAYCEDLKGRWITPGLIDCHTHLIFGGNRAKEFELRLNGASYEEIAKAGGGILSTVTHTRNETADQLFETAANRLNAMQNQGISTVEIKSGYGLDLETEVKMLKVAQRLEDQFDVTISKTFLGAHALPPEYKDDRQGYIDLVCEKMIPEIAQADLADAVDVFCENIGFTYAETEQVFKAAQNHGVRVKLHAEQLSDLSGSSLAASYNALSVDHLEYLSTKSIDAISASGTVAVLLPGAYYYLRETQLPPIEQLREKNVPIAIASDCNPGSSPLISPLLVLNMACTLFRLTPEEALTGMTINAAKALGLENSIGTLTVGKKADIAIWDISSPAELCYWIGSNPLQSLIVGGKTVVQL